MAWRAVASTRPTHEIHLKAAPYSGGASNHSLRTHTCESRATECPSELALGFACPTPDQNFKRPIGRILAVGTFLLATWGGFIMFATNEERLSSSIVRRVLGEASSSDAINQILGENIALEPSWLYFGAPRIAGQVASLCNQTPHLLSSHSRTSLIHVR